MSRYRIIMSPTDSRAANALDIRTNDSAVEVARAVATARGWYDPDIHDSFEAEVTVCYMLGTDTLEEMHDVRLAAYAHGDGGINE